MCVSIGEYMYIVVASLLPGVQCWGIFNGVSVYIWVYTKERSALKCVSFLYRIINVRVMCM